MRALTRLVAARSGQLLVPGTLANELDLSQPTVKRYLSLLEEVFLIKRIPAWSRNLRARAVSAPKVAVVDSGIAANLLELDADALRQPAGHLGTLLEGFVAMELSRQLTWSRQRAELYHYRTRDNVEVDLVLENRRGQVVAIEVKASSTVKGEDFRGLRHPADRLGTTCSPGSCCTRASRPSRSVPDSAPCPSPRSGRRPWARAHEDLRSRAALTPAPTRQLRAGDKGCNRWAGARAPGSTGWYLGAAPGSSGR